MGRQTLDGRVRVLLVIDSLRPGGAERQLVELVKGMDNSRYDIAVACLGESDVGYTKILVDLGIPIQYCLRKFKFDLFSPVLAVADIIRQRKIDVVHGFLNMGSLVAALAAKFTAKPVVCAAIQEAKDSNWKYAVGRIVLARMADCLVSNSKAGFNNRFKQWEPHFRIAYNGVDFSRFRPGNKSEIRKSLGLSQFGQVVGIVGSLNAYKDHETFLRMAKLVAADKPEVGFLLIGDGPRRDFLTAFASALGIADRVVFAGHRDDVDQLYSGLDVMVLVTVPIIEEGISNAIIEAMAMNVPVVATNAGGTPEIISDRKTGFLVPAVSPQATAAAVLELLNDQQLAYQMSQQAHAFVTQTFSLQQYVDVTVAIYNEVLAPSKNRALSSR